MLKFGTDGVRGVANAELTPELALALGRAAGSVLGGDQLIIGRDPRRSGPMLVAALAAGAASVGLDVLDLGVVPTPAVAHASAAAGQPGAVVSASHNPFADNGIKLFAAGGAKLDDATEDRLEAVLATLGMLPADGGDLPSEPARATGAEVGDIDRAASAGDAAAAIAAYRSSLLASLDGRHLGGVSVVLDCAHGAASMLAPDVLTAAGADVTVVHAAPDGININHEAGSTAPAALGRAVLDAGVDLGLALDGDADRLVAVDHTGAVVDGDHLIALLAIDRQDRGQLPADTVVATVMANLGFRQAMERRGITVVETAVGDRYVLEALARTGAVLGGEQSGHIIQTDRSTTGDGLLSALSVLDVLARRGERLADVAAEAMTSLPQVLVNVRLDARRDGLLDDLAADVAAAEKRLGPDGRVLVRASGTEPLIRVMVEAPTEERARTEADTLADAVRRLS